MGLIWKAADVNEISLHKINTDRKKKTNRFTTYKMTALSVLWLHSGQRYRFGVVKIIDERIKKHDVLYVFGFFYIRKQYVGKITFLVDGLY